MVVFNKVYDGEALYNLENDVIEAFNERFEKNQDDVVFDENGLLNGEFTVTIKWKEV